MKTTAQTLSLTVHAAVQRETYQYVEILGKAIPGKDQAMDFSLIDLPLKSRMTGENSHPDDQKELYMLEDEARTTKQLDKPRGWLTRGLSRTFGLLMYPFRKKFPGIGRKIKPEPDMTASEKVLLKNFDRETFLGENAPLMSDIEKTHGSLKKKFDTILHGQKTEAAKTITDLTEELRNPLDLNSQHGYIIQFMREYTLYSFSDIDLLGHLALCLGSLSSDKLPHITSNRSHDGVIRYTFMSLKHKVIDQISKHPEIVDPLIKGIFLPKKYITQVDSKKLCSSTSLFAPQSHQLITLDMSPEVEGKRDNVSILLEASRQAVNLLEQNPSLAEAEQSSLLVYLYILEQEFRSITQHTQSNQKDGNWVANGFHVFPKKLKVDLHNMSVLVHQQIVKDLSVSHH
ncbi:uncharacterized protein MELLADRAFT_59196 [Melampsora larici-populina 98AG31]|uniref:Uncharacterized protein n=1 Tax=Melampsora larici-populina (strain 98AG31 / pathotype 3-4-7) TaxID=747676 RepID=F4R5E1_MELLP|nr:uncharacterized protein MELLADRAFT_59196 [Melampsora larici-populina 98AG31]EGG12276.1 hypothetical protein MELLADRAFT_59196 [Melampsora larici-populina 98AG31]